MLAYQIINKRCKLRYYWYELHQYLYVFRFFKHPVCVPDLVKTDFY